MAELSSLFARGEEVGDPKYDILRKGIDADIEFQSWVENIRVTRFQRVFSSDSSSRKAPVPSSMHQFVRCSFVQDLVSFAILLCTF